MESWVTLGGKESRTNQVKSWQSRGSNGVGRQRSYQLRQPRPPNTALLHFFYFAVHLLQQQLSASSLFDKAHKRELVFSLWVPAYLLTYFLKTVILIFFCLHSQASLAYFVMIFGCIFNSRTMLVKLVWMQKMNCKMGLWDLVVLSGCKSDSL